MNVWRATADTMASRKQHCELRDEEGTVNNSDLENNGDQAPSRQVLGPKLWMRRASLGKK